MPEPLAIALCLAYAYLLGSVNAAFLAGRLVKGIDLRRVGTGTLGSSNVWYHVGKMWILPVGVFDLFVKGMTPVYLARYGFDLSIEWQVAAGVLSIIGHDWSVFLGFKGGRGVAPVAGVLTAMARPELALFIITASAGWNLTNNSATWVLIALAALPLWAWAWGRPVAIVLLMLAILAITVVKRLTSNARRPEGVGVGAVLFNRLVYDRDIPDHQAWVSRQSRATQ